MKKIRVNITAFNQYLISFRNSLIKKIKSFLFSIEIKNLTNSKNSQIINPVTGSAYKNGDDVPNGWRDPRYIGPEENGKPADNPARYLQPRQILGGISFKF